MCACVRACVCVCGGVGGGQGYFITVHNPDCSTKRTQFKIDVLD